MIMWTATVPAAEAPPVPSTTIKKIPGSTVNTKKLLPVPVNTTGSDNPPQTPAITHLPADQAPADQSPPNPPPPQEITSMPDAVATDVAPVNAKPKQKAAPASGDAPAGPEPVQGHTAPAGLQRPSAAPVTGRVLSPSNRLMPSVPKTASPAATAQPNNRKSHLFVKPKSALAPSSVMGSGVLPAAGSGQSAPEENESELPAQFVPGQLVIVCENSPQGDARLAALIQEHSLRRLTSAVIHTLDVKITLLETDTAIWKIVTAIPVMAPVLAVQPNYRYGTLTEPLDRLQVVHTAFGLERLHAKYRGRGVSVAVVDTGVAVDHEDLEHRIAASHNFIDEPYCSEIHGTAVAGIIAADINERGISGVAPEATLLALRACRQVDPRHPAGQCDSMAVCRAIDFAVQAKARIVNLSLGRRTEDPFMARLLQAGHHRGVLFVAPAGNREDQKRLAFPASSRDVIAVAGVDRDGRPQPNARVAAIADTSAPSAHLMTTFPGNRYNFLSGTSLSAATVSGLLAICLERGAMPAPGRLPPFDGDPCRWQEQLLGMTLCSP